VWLLDWSYSEAHRELGKTKDGEDVSGSINVPEVAHDTEPEDYVVCSQINRALKV
jgi:hypothetical protein